MANDDDSKTEVNLVLCRQISATTDSGKPSVSDLYSLEAVFDGFAVEKLPAKVHGAVFARARNGKRGGRLTLQIRRPNGTVDPLETGSPFKLDDNGAGRFSVSLPLTLTEAGDHAVLVSTGTGPIAAYTFEVSIVKAIGLPGGN